jgi:xyloglucan-specific exo-beta-1,4-glucanase
MLTFRDSLILAAIAAAAASPAPALAAEGSWSSLLDGGPVWAVAAHPTRHGWLLGGTKTAGIFRSKDGGATWQPARRGIETGWVCAIAFDPAHASVVYAGLQDSNPFLFKSRDGGTSWLPLRTGLQIGAAVALVVDPRRPRTLFATNGNQVSRSSDGGASWHVLNAGLTAGVINALAIDPAPQGALYAGASGVFRSNNGGASWTPAGLGPGQVSALAIAPRSSILYAAADNGLFKSADRGRTWTRQLSGALTSVAVDPESPEEVFAGGSELWRSTDGGATWRRADVNLRGFSVMAIAPVGGAGRAVVAGAADPIGFTGALFTSGDRGATWAVSGRGLVDRNILGFAADPAAPSTLYASDQDQGLFRSADAGLDWSALTVPGLSPAAGRLVIDPAHPSTLYLVAGPLFKTTDGGATWQHLGTAPVPRFPPGTGQFDSLSLQGLAVDPSDPSTLYGAEGAALFKSSDGGQSWASVAQAQDVEVDFFDVVVDPNAPATVYAAGAHVNAATSEPDGPTLFKSMDGGASWASVAAGLPAGLVRLAVEPTSSRLYAGTGGGLFVSGDGGSSWQRQTGITTEPILAVAVPAKGKVFAVQAAAGVHRSKDGGASWLALNSGLDTFPANFLVVADRPPPRQSSSGPTTTLYLGLAGGGLQSFDVP